MYARTVTTARVTHCRSLCLSGSRPAPPRGDTLQGHGIGGRSLGRQFTSHPEVLLVREAWIIDAARTPRGVGKIGKGALAEVHPQRILSTVLKALAERNGLDTRDIDDVIAGCGTQAGKQGSCIARMAALDAGYHAEATGFSLDRFCGSGLTAVNLAAMGVLSGMQNLVV